MRSLPIFLSCCFFASACDGPGEGAKAERGYARLLLIGALLQAMAPRFTV